MPAAPARNHKTQQAPSAPVGLRGYIRDRFMEIRRRPLTDYYMILVIVALLSGIGVVMVASASMTWSVLDGMSVWSTALRQTIMVAVGFAAMVAAMWVRPTFIRRFSGLFLLVSIVLLLLVHVPGLGTGRDEVGAQSWLVLGPLQFQPSEVARVAIAVWGAHFLADRKANGYSGAGSKLWNPLTQFSLVAIGITLLILLEGDLGMAVAFLLVVAALLFYAGIDWRFLALAGVTLVAGLALVFMGGGFRSNRFTVYFDALFGRFEDTRGVAFQSYQGFLSLADGGMFGVGIGQSRAKWFYLPEAKNDFIFAIIGEEMGLFGASIVIVLFGLLGIMGLRTARRSSSQFLGLLAATLTTSVVVQAFINIGYVIGVLPVTGIQLPMISAGGTSAVITLAAMGLLASCARHEPEAISAMQSYGRPAIDRLLFLREPTLQGLDTPKVERMSRNPQRPRQAQDHQGHRDNRDNRERIHTGSVNDRAHRRPPRGAAGGGASRRR
ncbi:FtsW/RodA/SpoVE family cell cycle protein [Corynebacterium kozikiae]|uniref:FtsW/RodA/SpoVE family cell cycle protein n=1 Tax=Corynebacterium kozikiae TaxID=2968469 RepID=UPI00359C3FFD